MYRQVREVYGKQYDFDLIKQSQKDVTVMLDEPEKQMSVREQLQQPRQTSEKQTHYTELAKNR